MRRTTPEEVGSAVSRHSGDCPRIVASGNHAAPRQLLSIVDAALPEFRLFMLNAQEGIPDREGVTHETPFIGPGMRNARQQLDYLPMRLSLVPHVFRTRRPDVVLIHTSPPLAGRVSLGIEVNILVAAIERCRANGGLVVAQMNRQMPYTFGDGEIPLDMIDLAIEVDEPLLTPASTQRSAIAEQIGQHVADLVEDGSTLQMGIGAVPDATLALVKRRRRLGVWSEMFSDGMLELEQNGSLDQSREIVASFLFGSQELYTWVDRNPRVRLLRTETTNDPANISAQKQMVSVNTALQVDLFAQANASRVHGRAYSGFGGQPDFTTGALHSPGGKALIALPSWHVKSDSSTIVPILDTAVTSFQHTALISEQGVAQIFGQDEHTQAHLIIDSVAHPDAREELREHADRLAEINSAEPLTPCAH